MIIEKLRLEGFKRLQLNNVHVFEIEPHSSLQLIIGTNGSGKSSILAELSPLPPNSKDFTKEGSKTVHIRHQSNHYIIKSTFGNHPHSFIRNGEELNPGGTITIQRELVKEHFSLTQDVFDLMLGKKLFHLMSISERREWFTKLSSMDYDYILSLYERVSKKARDYTGALRLARNRLVTETAKVMSSEDIENLRKETEELYQFIALLQDQRIPLDKTEDFLVNQLNNVSSSMETLSNKLLTKIINLKKSGVLSLEILDQELLDITAKVKLNQLKSESQEKDYVEIDKTYAALEKNQLQLVSASSVRIGELNLLMHSYLDKRSLTLDRHEDPESALRAIETVSEYLGTLLEDMPTNEDNRFSSQTLKTTIEEIEHLTLHVTRIRNKLEQMASSLRHYETLKNQGETECPNCQHKWIKNYNQNTVDALVANIEKGEKVLKTSEKDLESKKSYFEEIQSYIKKHQEFISIVNNWPILKYFWDHVSEQKILTNSPRTLLLVLGHYKSSLLLEIKAKEVTMEIKEVQNALAVKQQYHDVDFETVKQNRETLSVSIYETQSELRRLVREQTALTKRKNDLKEVTEMSKTISDLQSDHANLLTETTESIRRKQFNDFLRYMQSVLSAKDKALREIDMQSRLIEDIQNQIALLEKEEKLMKSLAKELSPTEGLIAESLFGFMKIFVRQMNDIIRKVWTYPLDVLPCKVSEEKFDLDYKFPLMVDNNEGLRDDVSQGSTAMQEIVNLAFKISSMKALHLNDYPIYLDEFGSSMDPTHKAATVGLIASIMEQEHFSQLYMISHDAIQYGALANAEICVLCDNNVTIPKNAVYNKHVVIH